MTDPGIALFGTIHLDRPSKVAAELDEFAGDRDAIFLERPPDDVGLAAYGRGLLLGPGVVLALAFYGLAFTPLYVLLVREPIPAEWVAVDRVATDRDLAVHAVDDHPLSILLDGGWRWRILGWAALLVPLALWPVATATTALVLVVTFLGTSLAYRIDRRVWLVCAIPVSLGGLVGGAWLGYLSVYPLSAFVFSFGGMALGTLSYRNRIMIERAAEIARREGYDDACVVTGKAHVGGMADLVEEFAFELRATHRSKFLRRSEVVTDGAPAAGRPDPALDTAGDVLGRRAAAAVVDAAVALLVFAPGLTAVEFLALTAVGDVDVAGTLVLSAAVAVPASPPLYHLWFESRDGQTVGKRAFDLVVVRTDGDDLSRGRALARNLFRPLGIASAYAVGAASALLTDRGQTPGDLLADAVVVSTGEPDGATLASDGGSPGDDGPDEGGAGGGDPGPTG